MNGSDHAGNVPEDLEALAGEYVLGVSSLQQRRAMERRMEDEPGLREAVARWEERLLPLATLVAPEPAPAGLWGRIERSLFPPQAATRETGLRPWWNSLALWRTLAAGGLAASLVLGWMQWRFEPAPARYVVVLVGPQDKSPGWVVRASGPSEIELIPLGAAAGAMPSGRALQLWTKADGWAGPASLGLVKPGSTLRIPLDRLPPIQPNQLFEITLEPPQGSPIDRPTGPIQFIGRAVQTS